MRSFGLGLAWGCGLLMAASAQTPAPAKETVTVSGTRPSVQVLPDRTVYSLKHDIQSDTGMVSDVLRNLPSVDVDIQGNVSLRGDTHVTILIDGKKSVLLAGNRADALQQLPASMVDSIEVITNPSAEFRAEGSAGIINIVLKKDKELVSSGLVRVNVGSEGRINASASGNLKLGRVGLHGAYGEGRNTQNYTASSLRSDGTNLRLSQGSSGKSVGAGRNAMLGATVNITKQDEIQLGGNYSGGTGHTNVQERYISISDASDITRNAVIHGEREGAQAMLNYRHRFAAKDEEFRFSLSRHILWGRSNSDYTSLITATGVANYWQLRQSVTRNAQTELTADYILPLPGPGKFTTGYALETETLLSDNRGFWRDPTLPDWSVDSTYTNNFVLDRTIHAGYVKYERKFGRFGAMGGLRLEQDFLNTNLKTTGEVHDTSNLGFYPSVHLSYALTDTQQLSLSYSRRVNRPSPSSLNPARRSSDPFNVSSGNPLLKPWQVDSFETQYRYTGEKLDAVVTGYYRATYKGITDVYRYLSSTVLLTTSDNLARSMASGIETNLNVTIAEGLSLRAGGTVSYNEFNPGPLAAGTKQSGLYWNTKGGIEWQATPDDRFQFHANYWAKRRLAQGYIEPTLSGDFSAKHTFEKGLAAVFSVYNLFDSAENTLVLDTPAVHQASHQRRGGRIFYIGLVYSFGGAKDTERDSSESEAAKIPSGLEP